MGAVRGSVCHHTQIAADGWCIPTLGSADQATRKIVPPPISGGCTHGGLNPGRAEMIHPGVKCQASSRSAKHVGRVHDRTNTDKVNSRPLNGP
jgi:hypothetical protein